MKSLTLLSALLLGVLCLAPVGLGRAQSVLSLPPPAIAYDAQDVLQPETVAARRAALQARLEALQQTALPAAELEASSTLLEQILATLTALEEMWQQRATFLARSEAIPAQLDTLDATRRRLDAQPMQHFPHVTAELRDQYEAEHRAVQVALQEDHTRAEADERRLVAIPKALEQLAAERASRDRDLLMERSKGGEQDKQLGIELVLVKRQLLEATGQALEAEREWLSKRRAVYDAQRSVNRLRLQRLQQVLDTMKQALGATLQQEQAALQGTEKHLAQQLEHTADPIEALRLSVQQDIVDTRKRTAEYQQQRHSLREVMHTQEQRTTQEKQYQERLASLMEKYADSSAVAQHFASAFERLQRERVRYPTTPVKTLERRLAALTTVMFRLDDVLYAFDEEVAVRLATLPHAGSVPSSAQDTPSLHAVRQAFDAHKVALREQQQELTVLLQDVSTLLTLYREHKRLLDDGSRFVLTKIFWLRNAEPLGSATPHDVWEAMKATLQRLLLFARAEYAQVHSSVTATPSLWSLFVLAVPCLLGGAAWAYKRLGNIAHVIGTRRGSPPSGMLLTVTALQVLRAALWPAMLVLFTWCRGFLIPENVAQDSLTNAAMRALQTSALGLWVGLASRALLRRHGLLQQMWGWPPELCGFLWRVVLLGGGAVLVFLVPQQMLLLAPGEGQAGTNSFLLTRLLFLALQGVLLLLVGVVARRHSLVMQRVLASSQTERGLLWRAWPLVYLALLGGIMTIMTLESFGYDYAARYIWSHTLASLGVLLGGLGVIRILGLRAIQGLTQAVGTLLGHWQQQPADVQVTVVQRTGAIASMVWTMLAWLLVAGLILQMWGVSIAWVATIPATLDIAKRLLVTVLTIGLTAGIIHISQALTDSLLQPRVMRWGDRYQMGRKLRTLAPLVQAIIRVVAIFVAVLVILEQLGIATGPLLAGVGIFGLAIGFASQSLIKDVINGLFLLFEDSLSVGDVVMLRGTGGLVEKVTLRTVTLRDLSGNVHIIPNSTIEMVTNMTMGYSYYVFNIRVAYSQDIDAVMNILRDIDEELRQDPAYALDILAPLEIFGLDRFEASAMVIQARCKTRPIQQWRVGREFNRRMKKAFDAHGIEMPFPHRVLSGWVSTRPLDVPPDA